MLAFLLAQMQKRHVHQHQKLHLLVRILLQTGLSKSKTNLHFQENNIVAMASDFHCLAILYNIFHQNVIQYNSFHTICIFPNFLYMEYTLPFSS